MSATPPKPPNRCRPRSCRSNAGAGLVDFGLGWAVGSEARSPFRSGFERLWFHVWPGGHVAFGDGGQLQRIEIAVDRLGDLLLVDQLAVEPAGLAAAEDVHEKVGIGVARAKAGGVSQARRSAAAGRCR